MAQGQRLGLRVLFDTQGFFLIGMEGVRRSLPGSGEFLRPVFGAFYQFHLDRRDRGEDTSLKIRMRATDLDRLVHDLALEHSAFTPHADHMHSMPLHHPDPFDRMTIR